MAFGGGGLTFLLAAIAGNATIVVVTVVALGFGVLCWIVNDTGRTERLSSLISACRGDIGHGPVPRKTDKRDTHDGA